MRRVAVAAIRTAAASLVALGMLSAKHQGDKPFSVILATRSAVSDDRRWAKKKRRGRGAPPLVAIGVDAYFDTVDVPEINTAPGPGSPAVASTVLLPVAEMQNVAASVPAPFFG